MSSNKINIMDNKNVQINEKSAQLLKKRYPQNKNSILVKTSVLGVQFTNASREDILELIFSKIKRSNECCYVVTPNPEMLVLANKDNVIREILNSATVSVCDGIGVLLASKLLGTPLSSRFTGVDAVKAICSESAKRTVTIGLLGGREGIAEKTAECLRRENPNIRIIFTTSEWDQKYNNTSVDMLFVAFGFPKQERWIAEHCGKIPAKMMMGVGGAFDYISGTIPRAPRVLRSLGLEWLFRLMKQPWRWKRQLALIQFVLLVVKKIVIRST